MTEPSPGRRAGRAALVIRSYSSDQSGLVCGFRFRGGSAGEAIGTDEALRWFADEANDRGESFLWLHFDLTRASSEKWLRDRVDLPQAFFDALHEGSSSTRIELEDGRLVVVVNDVLYDFGFEATHLATLWVCADRGVVVTTRRKPLRSIDRLRVAVRRGEGFESPASLLVHLLRDQADVLIAIVRDATARIDGIEDSLLAGRLEANRANLGAELAWYCQQADAPTSPRVLVRPAPCASSRPGFATARSGGSRVPTQSQASAAARARAGG